MLGRVELRELLDPEVIACLSAQLQHLTPEKAARDAEGAADLLRLLGPLTTEEISARAAGAAVSRWLEHLLTARRVLTVAFGGQRWWVAIEDIGRLRDGLGVAVPPGVPMGFTDPVADPLGELLGRFARTRGRSPPDRPRTGSGWECGSRQTRWVDWPPTDVWCVANSPTSRTPRRTVVRR